MAKEEILEYIFLCISYKHNNDISPYITKSACEKENLLFENAIEFLDKLEKENAELKEKLDNLASVAEVRLANWQKYEKAYNEAEELLDKQIEATYKLFEENKELKEKLGDVQMQKAGEKSDLVWKLKTANEQKAEQLTYAKTIIQDLLDNTDEYARQKAEDFLKENK